MAKSQNQAVNELLLQFPNLLEKVLEMKTGPNVVDALGKLLTRFGHSDGLHEFLKSANEEQLFNIIKTTNQLVGTRYVDEAALIASNSTGALLKLILETPDGVKDLEYLLNLPDMALTKAENLIESELLAATKLSGFERLDGAHSLKRHGPQITDAMLQNRIQFGYAPDGMFSGSQGSTRFSSFETMLEARESALKAIEKVEGVDFSKPPIGVDSYSVKVEFNKPIDEGFVGDASTGTKITQPDTKKKAEVYSTLSPVDGITRVQISVEWDGTKWRVGQLIPWALNGWNDVSKTYGTPPDIHTNLL